MALISIVILQLAAELIQSFSSFSDSNPYIFRCRIATLNFSMGFNITSPYMLCVTHKQISPSVILENCLLNNLPSPIINRNQVIYVCITPFSKMPEPCLKNSIVFVIVQQVQVWNNLENCLILRLPHRNDAKIAKICNRWTFWPVIQPINNLYKISQRPFSGF